MVNTGGVVNTAGVVNSAGVVNTAGVVVVRIEVIVEEAQGEGFEAEGVDGGEVEGVAAVEGVVSGVGAAEEGLVVVGVAVMVTGHHGMMMQAREITTVEMVIMMMMVTVMVDTAMKITRRRIGTVTPIQMITNPHLDDDPHPHRQTNAHTVMQ